MVALAHPPPAIFKLLAHDLRWRLLSALARSDHRVRELVDLVGEPINVVSYHLKQLRRHQLVVEQRSAADGRDVYYRLDLERLRALYQASGAALHPSLDDLGAADTSGPLPAVRVLFLCTHNSARSQMAEALLRSLSRGQIVVASAGTEPAAVHPDAVRVLAELGVDISQQYAKHLDTLAHQPFDYIISVCDRAAETCPVFPNDPEHIHWSFRDPAASADPTARYHAFVQTATLLSIRIRHLLTVIARTPRSQL